MNKNMNSIVKRAGVALLVACVCMLLICGIIGALVQAEVVPEQMGSMLALLLTELALFWICYVAVKTVPQSRLPVALGIAAAFVAVCFLVKAIMFPGEELDFGWKLLLPFAAALIAGCLASMKKQRRR